MKRREEKWGRKKEWATCQRNIKPFIDRYTPTFFFRNSRLPFSLPLLYHSPHSNFASVLHVSFSLCCLYLLSSCFSFPLFSVLVFSFPLCSAFRRFLLQFTGMYLLSFLLSFIVSFQPSVHPCVRVLSSSLYASLGNGTEGGQRASTH